MDFINSWDKTVSALASIGTGISALHDHQVLHRDLHLNNILVTDRYYPHDPDNPHEYGFLITDIGEGKILREGKEFADVSDHLASYGSIDFRAPEVHGSDGWTPKAEVFSFGVIACKIFRIRQYACTAAPPAWVVERTHKPQLRDRHPVNIM
jgi:serine/threonine protein kinase